MAIDAHLVGEDDRDPVDVKLKMHPEIHGLLKRLSSMRGLRMGDVVTMLLCASQGEDYAPYIVAGITDARTEPVDEDESAPGPSPHADTPTTQPRGRGAHSSQSDDEDEPAPGSSGDGAVSCPSGDPGPTSSPSSDDEDEDAQEA